MLAQIQITNNELPVISETDTDRPITEGLEWRCKETGLRKRVRGSLIFVVSEQDAREAINTQEDGPEDKYPSAADADYQMYEWEQGWQDGDGYVGRGESWS